MSHKVTIFTKPFCSYCQRAKDLLRIKGVAFDEYDITVDPSRAAEMQPYGDQAPTPSIFIDNTLIGGCLELFDLDENGTLDTLLQATSSAS